MIARAAFIALIMTGVALAVGVVRPEQKTSAQAPDLAAMLPGEFAEWTPVEIASVVLPVESEIGPGEDIAYRAWRSSTGRIVTLVAAYGPPLGDSVRLHRPEACYRGQGYQVSRSGVSPIDTPFGDVPLIRLETEKALRREAVSYWLRDGNDYVQSEAGHQLLFFKRGLSGDADGALIRVSTLGDGENAYAVHDQFLQDFVAALPPEGRRLLLASQ
ncbi:MAG: exosortase C-terminal domain/associated protein EpsI [Pseudomonadota bacterium]